MATEVNGVVILHRGLAAWQYKIPYSTELRLKRFYQESYTLPSDVDQCNLDVFDFVYYGKTWKWIFNVGNLLIRERKSRPKRTTTKSKQRHQNVENNEKTGANENEVSEVPHPAEKLSWESVSEYTEYHGHKTFLPTFY